MSYRLYVWLRSDLQSMTPGKAAAQVAHAASQCAMNAYSDPTFRSVYAPWESEDQLVEEPIRGFGTTIVLDGGDGAEMEMILQQLMLAEMQPASDDTDTPPHFWGQVLDPTYPVKDGYATHLIPLLTCVWVFAPADHKVVRDYNLYQGNSVW